ncbi:MAG TPA: hypothetical protein VKA64_07875 [Gammaproteobacteria bacterium]|nr:hypothetical protein [Gammaproteobacteria bacterium]
MALDRFTRNYLVFLGLLAAAALGGWASTWSPRVGELNGKLADDAVLTDYPYRFRVLALEDGVATLTTPRSYEVPAVRFLGIIEPRLANRAPDDPEVVAAQKRLAKHQGRARKLVLAEPDVDRVRWQLDRDWYADHGVVLR